MDHPQELCTWIEPFLPKLEERSIVAVTSKVVSVCEGRTVPQHSISKTELIAKEADRVIPNPEASDDRILLTYKNHLLIPSAGVDESNGNGQYILYPQDPFQSAQKLWSYLREKRSLQSLGVMITDSHTTPLRWGVTGVALAWWGFEPVTSYIGKPDLFGHPLRVTKINVVDALAVSAVFTMGESSEKTPVAIITDAPHVNFTEKPQSVEEICVDPQDDLYRPLLKPLWS